MLLAFAEAATYLSLHCQPGQRGILHCCWRDIAGEAALPGLALGQGTRTGPAGAGAAHGAARTSCPARSRPCRRVSLRYCKASACRPGALRVCLWFRLSPFLVTRIIRLGHTKDLPVSQKRRCHQLSARVFSPRLAAFRPLPACRRPLQRGVRQTASRSHYCLARPRCRASLGACLASSRCCTVAERDTPGGG